MFETRAHCFVIHPTHICNEPIKYHVYYGWIFGRIWVRQFLLRFAGIFASPLYLTTPCKNTNHDGTKVAQEYQEGTISYNGDSCTVLVGYVSDVRSLF